MGAQSGIVWCEALPQAEEALVADDFHQNILDRQAGKRWGGDMASIPSSLHSPPRTPAHSDLSPPPRLLTSPFLYSGFPSIIRIFWILKERKYVHERQKEGPPKVVLQSQSAGSPSFDDVHRHGSGSGDEATDHAGTEVAQNIVREVA